ncbi:hypothetical protein [Streptomyces sp. NPDC006551]|uniref:hypothetical protein n=1 Tax=Streptomyces sp. NPDC006551 TaxID=3157178 RepID=UPI0033A3DF9E
MGDVTPPWPGPVTALSIGEGPLAGSVLMTGPDGTVRAVELADASPRGRAPLACLPAGGLTILPDGTLLMLDENGRIQAESAWAARPAGSGIAGLLDDGPTSAQRLVAAVQGHTGTAVASATGHDAGIIAIGSGSGTVEILGDIADSARLHNGPVNALAAIRLPLEGEASLPFVYSGGADGTVRAWAPGNAPMDAPVLQRSCPVVSLDAASTQHGPAAVVAWGDGAVDWIQWDTGEQQTFRPGPPVRAVALAADNRVVVAMDEALTCLVPKQPRLGGDPAPV